MFSDKKNINIQKNPNRIEIIRDFDHLIDDHKQCFTLNNQHQNNVILSKDKLYSKLQKSIFNKITHISDHNKLKNILMNDFSYNERTQEIHNIYNIADLWCRKKYDLI